MQDGKSSRSQSRRRRRRSPKACDLLRRHTEVHSVKLACDSQDRSTGAGSRTWQPKELGVCPHYLYNFWVVFTVSSFNQINSLEPWAALKTLELWKALKGDSKWPVTGTRGQEWMQMQWRYIFDHAPNCATKAEAETLRALAEAASSPSCVLPRSSRLCRSCRSTIFCPVFQCSLHLFTSMVVDVPCLATGRAIAGGRRNTRCRRSACRRRSSRHTGLAAATHCRYHSYAPMIINMI